jgi:hypothetical protein
VPRSLGRYERAKGLQPLLKVALSKGPHNQK